VLPIVIIAAVAIPLLVIAFLASRRSDKAGEHPAGETDAHRQLVEQEYDESERYQAEWREEHKHETDSPL
jgi:YD repeat-containing protein